MDLISVVKRGRSDVSPWKKRKLNSIDSVMINSEKEDDAGVGPCTVSPQNVVAFSSYGRLLKTHMQLQGQTLNSVFVADLNTPWDCHTVKSSLAQVTVLEWDQSGHYLLIGDSAGYAEIWTPLTHLLNEWTKVAFIFIQDEPIQAGIFFNNGKRTMANFQQRESLSYTEKYSQVEMKPTIRGFGGRPLEGFLVVGMTGIVQAFVMGGSKGKTTNAGILGGLRLAYSFVDLAWTKDGEILAIACTGLAMDPIVYCKLSIQKDDGVEFSCQLDEYRLLSEPLTGLFPQHKITAEDVQIRGVSFSYRESPNGIYLMINDSNGGRVEYWELVEQNCPVHSLFTTSSSTSSFLNWQCLVAFNYHASITNISSSRNVWITGQESAPQAKQHLVVATANGELLCLHQESMKLVAQLNLFENVRYESVISNAVTSMSFTATGNALVCYDKMGTMFICKLSPITDPGGSVTINYMLMALEYCLLTGVDSWDVLLGLKQSFLDTLCERFNEHFQLQTVGLQQLLQFRMSNIKLSLYRLNASGSSKAGLQYGIIMLNSVYSALKSLLRPPLELFNHDRSPADSLTAVLSSKIEGMEIDKVLLHLEVKEFTVEPSTLITVQHLIQWTVTFVLKLLTNLSDWRKGAMYELVRDPKLLNMARELLVIFRIWGLIRHSCLPTYSYMENIDVIAILFRILTRLLQTTSDQDEILLDECCQLSTQLIVPDVGLSLPPRGLASPCLFNRFPLQMEYGVSPEEVYFNKHDAEMDLDLHIDSIRHVFLGSRPQSVRYCSRCKGNSIIVKGLRVSRSAAAKSWDLRWSLCCPCGGRWCSSTSPSAFKH